MTYQSRKTPIQRADQYAFLLTKKQSAVKNPDGEQFWYSNSPMGENMIGKLLKTACEEAGIDTANRKITGTSARKTLVQSSAESGVPANVVSKLTGQAREQSQLDYMVLMKHGHQAASIVTSRSVMGKETKNFNTVFDDLKSKKPENKVTEPAPQNQLVSSQGPSQNSSYQPPQGPNFYPSPPEPTHNSFPPPPGQNHYNSYFPTPNPSQYSSYYPPPPQYGSFYPPPPPQYGSFYPPPPGPSQYSSFYPPPPPQYGSFYPPPPGQSQYSTYQQPAGPSPIPYQPPASPQNQVQLKTDDNKENIGPGPEPEENRNYVFKFRKINTSDYSYTYL